MMEAISPTFFMEEISPILNFMRNSRSTAEISVMCSRLSQSLNVVCGRFRRDVNGVIVKNILKYAVQSFKNFSCVHGKIPFCDLI